MQQVGLLKLWGKLVYNQSNPMSRTYRRIPCTHDQIHSVPLSWKQSLWIQLYQESVQRPTKILFLLYWGEVRLTWAYVLFVVGESPHFGVPPSQTTSLVCCCIAPINIASISQRLIITWYNSNIEYTISIVVFLDQVDASSAYRPSSKIRFTDFVRAKCIMMLHLRHRVSSLT